MQSLLTRLEEELKLRNYSRKTIISYLLCLRKYVDFLTKNSSAIKGLTSEEKVRKFLLQHQERGDAGQTINLYLNAIKFFYREILKSVEKIDLKFSKTSKKLPVVLSRQEIGNILGVIENKKHKLLIALGYGAGLRISEVIKLKTRDIDLDEATIHLKEAKGKKDRITVLPEKIKHTLREIMAGKKADDYVFASERGGRLSERTAQKIFENALDRKSVV